MAVAVVEDEEVGLDQADGLVGQMTNSGQKHNRPVLLFLV